MIKLSNEFSGGSFHHVTINSSVNELIDVLGHPQHIDNTGNDKVNFEWDCITECERKIRFYIYDWKEYRELSYNEQIEFHIGGKNFEETSYAQGLLMQMIKDNREDNKSIEPEVHAALDELRDIYNNED